MRRSVDGVIYDTEKSQKILSAGDNNHQETLYKSETESRRCFLVVKKRQMVLATNESQFAESIAPLTEIEARAWLEKLNSDVATECLEKYFPHLIEEA